MAVYKLEVKTFGRNQGSRVTRAAAYRAGERMRDERMRESYDYSDREDVTHKEILLPAQFAGNPSYDWARDRAALWNTAENTDRHNARLAREVMVILPGEMTHEQRVHLARRFAQDLSDRYGNAVDLAIHLPREGAKHHHAHLLMTTRQVIPEGLADRTVWELAGGERRALGLTKADDDLLLVRERWEQFTNQELARAGFSSRVDRRSLKARGINREPAPIYKGGLFYIERNEGSTRAGEAIRKRHWERVQARLEGPQELDRVIKRQRAEARQRILERDRQREHSPKRRAQGALTKEEALQLRRDRRQLNSIVANQIRNDQRAVARWERWRSQQAEARSLTPSPEDSIREWLAFRQRQIEPPTVPTPAPAALDEIDNSHKKRIRDHEYDYGL